MYDVSIVRCNDYDFDNIHKAMDELINLIGGLDFVKPGMKIVIKANLVAPMKPDTAAITHPALVSELVSRLVSLGAVVTVGDSPGGVYNSIYLNKVYSATSFTQIEKVGGMLNKNFAESIAHFDDAKIIKTFPYTAYLDEADVIINFSKLKSHGMMGMSAATKNLYGTIPGTQKPEFHFKFPNHLDFANLLVDLNEFFKPKICFVDAVVAMEGNGPTAGTPKHIGYILASSSPYLVDLVCASIIGLEPSNIPYLTEAYKRGLCPATSAEVSTNIPINELVVSDFDVIREKRMLSFQDNSKLLGRISRIALSSKPILDKNLCVGCAKCVEVCPAKAVSIIDGKAVIDRKKCIRCFCCQEFCPRGAMKVKRNRIAKLLSKM